MAGEEHRNDSRGESGHGEPIPDPVRAKLSQQLGLVVGEQGIPGAVVYPPDWFERGSFDFIYREGFLLMRDGDVEAVNAIVNDGRAQPRRRTGTTSHHAFATGPAGGDGAAGNDPVPSSRASTGTRNLSLLEILPRLEHEIYRTAPEWCQLLDDQLGVGVATPDHLLYTVQAVTHCPATEPEPVRAAARPVPDARLPERARDVSVFILDSGWFPAAGLTHDWLAGVQGAVEDTYALEDGQLQIQSYSGHGTFCAGVLRSVAPRTDVYVARTFYLSGGVFESDIAPQVVQAVSAGADVISLSAGTHTFHDLPLLGFQVVKETIEAYKGVVLVCAAGNDGSRQPFFPAALDWTVSVGALSTDGQERAWFSNYGGWVDCYAPGEDLVNAFPTGMYTCKEAPNVGQVRHFDGMARWSGTSFATPLVAGLIADRMSRTGENGKQAAQSVLARARADFRPGVGPVLLPGHDEGSRRPHEHQDHHGPGRHRHHHE
jgi:subtilisin family serine protease